MSEIKKDTNKVACTEPKAKKATHKPVVHGLISARLSLLINPNKADYKGHIDLMCFIFLHMRIFYGQWDKSNC